MLRGWEQTTLADVSSDIAYGYTESASDEKIGPRFLRITDIQNGVVNWANVPYCPTSSENHQKYRLLQGDIVVARTGNSTGENYLYQGAEDAVFASYLIRFRIDRKKANPKFVWYNLRTRVWWNFIDNSKTGSAQAGANAKILGRFPLCLPPLPEQRTIAHILGTLDDKIELNRRMNETLEAMARALFKSWFVDFEPVRAKSERRDIGLPKDIADLFPDSFEDSELGEVPKGWRVVELPEAIEVNPPRSLRKGEIAPYLDMANVPTNTARADQVIEREFGSGAKFKNGDTLLARITPCLENGKTAYVDFLRDGQVGWGSTEFIILSPKPPMPPEFAYFLARDEGFRNFAIFNMTGTSGRQRVPADCFTNYLLAVPSSQVAKAFSHFAASVMQKIKTNDEESRTLAAQRDILLPKLLSGEMLTLTKHFLDQEHLLQFCYCCGCLNSLAIGFEFPLMPMRNVWPNASRHWEPRQQ